MAEVDVAAYLRRLGIQELGPPSVAALYALHRAHVEHVPYENLDIQLGRASTVDPYESAARVVGGRGGYCYHLNGAFAALLLALGFQVRWHLAGVQRRTDLAPPGACGNHLALTVHGLPSAECPDGVWLADVGLGDALHEPLPLRAAEYRQGPFTFQVTRSPVIRNGWRLTHDPEGSFAGMDFEWRQARPSDVAATHQHLSTAAESPFVKVAVVQRRDAHGLQVLRGCMLTHHDAAGRRAQEIQTSQQWYAVLHDLFGLDLDGVSEDERRTLWHRVRAAHDAWRMAPSTVAG